MRIPNWSPNYPSKLISLILAIHRYLSHFEIMRHSPDTLLLFSQLCRVHALGKSEMSFPVFQNEAFNKLGKATLNGLTQ